MWSCTNCSLYQTRRYETRRGREGSNLIDVIHDDIIARNRLRVQHTAIEEDALIPMPALRLLDDNHPETRYTNHIQEGGHKRNKL